MVVDVLLRADHEAVSVLETPDAPGRAGVHVVHAFRLHACRVLQGDLPVRVAAVDDDVSGVAELDQRVDALRGGLAGRHHHPHDARARLERLDEVLKRVGPHGALGDM